MSKGSVVSGKTVGRHPRRELRYHIEPFNDGGVWTQMRQDIGYSPDKLNKLLGASGTAWFYYEHPVEYQENRSRNYTRRSQGRPSSPTVNALAELADQLGMELTIELKPKALLERMTDAD